MTTPVFSEALNLVPVAGPVLSAMLTFVDSSLQTHDKLKEQWQQLQVDLPKWSAQLEQVAVEKPDHVRDLQDVVTKFEAFLKDNTPPRRRDMVLDRSKVQDFWLLVSQLEVKIKSTSFLMTAETLVEVSLIRDQLTELVEKHNLSLDKMDDLKEQGTGIQASLDILMKTGLDNGHVQLQPEGIRSALAVLQSAGSRSDNEKHDAKQTLLHWLEGWTDQPDALKVALLFARDGGDDVKLVGLDILVQMSGDDEKRQRLFASGEVLEVLLAEARGEVTDAATTLASRCLTNLVREEPATFFVKWERMHECHRDVVDVGLMRQIVASVRHDPKEEESEEDQALRVLAQLSCSEVCKPAVARAGGIGVLAKVYTATENMSTAMTKATVSSLVLLAVDALASLAMDATCRATFTKEDGYNIRPLVHFLWSCSALSTRVDYYDYKVYSDPENYSWEEDIGPVVTPFGRHRIKKAWQSENAASEALCALLGDDAHCRDVVLKLGPFIDVESGEIPLAHHSRTNPRESGHSLAGWAAFANQVVEGMKDIERAVTKDGEKVWPSKRVALGPDLVRAVWDLVDDHGGKSGLVAVRNLMKGGSRASVLGFFLFCGQFKILDYDELLDSSAPAIESTRAIRWAKEYKNLDPRYRAKGVAEYFWAACVLMSALTPTRPSRGQVREDLVRLSLEMNEELLKGDEKDSEPFLPLVERWVIKTKRSDMDEDCIPFLDIGARWFTSPADDSEDEDDDSSSEGDRSGDDSSDSDDGDGSDTSKHSESSQQRADDVDDSDTSKHSESSQESAYDVVRDPSWECVVRLADLWPDHEDAIRVKCSVSVLREVHTLLPADATIEVVLDHDVNNQPREIRVKVNGDSTVGDLKQLVAEQVGTLPEKIRIFRYFKAKGTSYFDKDDTSLKTSRILDRTKLVYVACA